MIWNEEMETMPRADLEKLQGERLQNVVARVARGTRGWGPQGEGQALLNSHS